MKRIGVVIAATTVATMGSAQAAPTTFTFDSSVKGQTSIVKSLDGINLTINNFLTGPKAGADGDGLAVYCVSNALPYSTCTDFFAGFQPYVSLAMTFDQPVKLLSYNVSYETGSADSSTTYQQGALQSIQVNNTATGSKLFNNQFLAAANVPIAVSSVDPSGDGLLQINAFTVEKVDVPGPLPLAGAAAAFSWSRRLRSRISRTARV
ncbi:MAG: hypothetical protein ACK587_01935 [Cyanobacteriota bacterium]